MMLRQIAQSSAYQEIIKKSKFIGICYPVSSVDEARAYIGQTAARHPKATHVCWACRLRVQADTRAYFSDAGEPAHSAGPPIRTALESRGLVNTLCLVVRYFGGVKLGIGGLIRAYRRVAGQTLDQAGIKTIADTVRLCLQVPHQHYADIMRLIESKKISFQQEYQPQGANLILEIPARDKQAIIAALQALPAIEIKTDPDQKEPS